MFKHVLFGLVWFGLVIMMMLKIAKGTAIMTRTQLMIVVVVLMILMTVANNKRSSTQSFDQHTLSWTVPKHMMTWKQGSNETHSPQHRQHHCTATQNSSAMINLLHIFTKKWSSFQFDRKRPVQREPRQTDRQRQTERQAGRQRQTQTDRQTDRQR